MEVPYGTYRTSFEIRLNHIHVPFFSFQKYVLDYSAPTDAVKARKTKSATDGSFDLEVTSSEEDTSSYDHISISFGDISLGVPSL